MHYFRSRLSSVEVNLDASEFPSLSEDIMWKNSAKMLGIADDAGINAIMDEFGNTFRSFFIACDPQDLLAAGFQPVIFF